MSFSPFTKAETSTVKKVYESGVFVPWQFLADQALAGQTENGVAHFNFNLGSMKFVVQEIPVNLSNIQVEIDTVIKNLGSERGETLWQADRLNTRIIVSGFSINKTVDQWYGGVRATIKLSATCESFELTQPSAQMNMSWGWKSEGTQLEADLSALNITWPKNSWKVGQIKCAGPSGFGDLVKAEITKQLANPDRFVSLIKTHLETYFNQTITKSLEQYRKPQRLFSDFQTALVMEMTGVEATVEKGLLLKGIIEVQRLGETSASSEEQVVALDVNKMLQSLDGETPALIFPGLAAESLIGDVAQNRVAFYQLNKFEGFTKLLASKFMQFFVWPDLMKYNKTSVFNVTSKVSGRPVVNYTGDHKMWIQGYVDSWIYSKRDGYDWRYVDLRTGFAAYVFPEVTNGHIRFKFSDQNMKSVAQMNADYVKYYKPRQHLGLSTIEKAIKKAPFFEGFSLELPSIELKSGLSLKADKLIHADKDTYIIQLSVDESEGIAGL